MTDWTSGVRDKFVRASYERAPEDVVKRLNVQAGPPLRFLRAASRRQTVRGELPLTRAEAASFEAWRRETLDHGVKSFTFTLYDHPASRQVTARFAAPPILKAKGPRRRLALELTLDPPIPSGASLTALAGHHLASPASWPAGLPSAPRRADYEAETAERILRSPEEANPIQVLTSRVEGGRERVSLRLSPAELEDFELWFETEACFGARDIAFPVTGGTHLGCFSSSYVVKSAGNLSGWRVEFERYLEAQP